MGKEDVFQHNFRLNLNNPMDLRIHQQLLNINLDAYKSKNNYMVRKLYQGIFGEGDGLEEIKTEKVITGTFTVAQDISSNNLDYLPQSVEEWPSWLIIIAEKDTPTEYFSFKGMWVIHIVYSNVKQKHDAFSYNYSFTTYGYNTGTNKYYTPYVNSGEVLYASTISCNPAGVSSHFLAGVTYRYYMGFG